MELSELIAWVVLSVPFAIMYRMVGKFQSGDRTYEPTGGYSNGSVGDIHIGL